MVVHVAVGVPRETTLTVPVPVTPCPSLLTVVSDTLTNVPKTVDAILLVHLSSK